MAKRKAKPGRLRGFGLSEDRDGGAAAAMGFVGREEEEDGYEFDFGLKPVNSNAALNEPILRVANVGSLAGVLALSVLGSKSLFTPVVVANLIDIVGRQMSQKYRDTVKLGPWNRGMFQ